MFLPTEDFSNKCIRNRVYQFKTIEGEAKFNFHNMKKVSTLPGGKN